jgi:ferredoxin
MAEIVDLDGCMECGACANNCPTLAIQVRPGVGCASYIIKEWVRGTWLDKTLSNNCC